MLREHSAPVRNLGVTLFELALPDRQPTLVNRRRWTSLVKGRLAERWLVGDDTVEAQISEIF